MKKFLKKTIDEKKKIENEYGINYEVMNNTCTAGHQLKAHYGLVRPYKNAVPKCDECGQKDLHMHEFFYHCGEGECKYDLCRLCALTTCKPPVLSKEIKTSVHEHNMKKREPNKNSGWNCDISHREGGAGIECESAIPGFSKTEHIQGYKCAQGCDFLVCLKCALKYNE